MKNFEIKLVGNPTEVGGEAIHQAFSIHLDDKHVGNGLNVEHHGRSIRVFDYDVPLKGALEEYFSSRKGVKEVTFSRPYNG